MNKRLIPQIYGYAVCLVAIIAFLIGGRQVVDSTLTYVQPSSSYECNGYYGYPKVDGLAPADEKELEEKCHERAKNNALRSLANNGFLVLAAILLFGLHWRWMHRMHEEK